MLRIARGYVRSHQSAEDVVQDTWIAVVKGITKFEADPQYVLSFSRCW
jgi:RNA polymerase sigma-70 factor, ECF subfamily